MFREYLASLRYYRLKRQFQQLRFQIFRAMEDFDIEFEQHELSETSRPHLESIIQLFPALMEKIKEVERAESGAGRGDIFDENTYYSVTRREILRILRTIQQTLEEYFQGLKLAEMELSSIQDEAHILLHQELNTKLLREYSQTLHQLDTIIERLEMPESIEP